MAINPEEKKGYLTKFNRKNCAEEKIVTGIKR